MDLRRRPFAALRRRKRHGADTPPPCVGCRGRTVDRLEVVVAGLDVPSVADSIVRPVAGLQTAVIGSDVVVVDPRTARRVLLNTTGALIFTAVDRDRRVGDVVDQLADETGAAVDAIASDVLGTIDRLIGQGLLTRDDLVDPHGVDEVEATNRPEVPPPTPANPQSNEPGGWAYRSGVRSAAGVTISVRAEPTGLDDLLDAALAGFPAASADASGGGADASAAGDASADRTHAVADHRIDLVAADGADETDAVRLVIDDAAPSAPLNPGAAVARLFDQLDVVLAETAPGLRFHAGAVERDGRVVLVLGNSGDGKSTLTGALVQAGWRYLTDELVVVDPGSFRVHPYPRPLDLDATARTTLGIGEVDLATGAPKDKVFPARLGAVSTGGTPVLLVLLTDARHDGPATVPPAEALMSLLALTFEHTFDDPEALANLARLCETTRTVRIGRAPTAAMVAEVLAQLED